MSAYDQQLADWLAGEAIDADALARVAAADPELVAELRELAIDDELLAIAHDAVRAERFVAATVAAAGYSGDREAFADGLQRRLPRRGWLLAAALLLAALLPLPWLLHAPPPLSVDGAAVVAGAALELRTGETLAWADGSRAVALSAARVVPEAAGCALERGVLQVEVAPRDGQEAAFTVTTVHGSVRVLGTGFRVELAPGGLLCAVDHGRVAVERAGERLELGAGQFALAPAGAALELAPSEGAALDQARRRIAAPVDGEARREHFPLHGRLDAQPLPGSAVIRPPMARWEDFQRRFTQDTASIDRGRLPLPWGVHAWDPESEVEVATHEADGHRGLLLRTLHGRPAVMLNQWRPLELAPDTRYQVFFRYRSQGEGRASFYLRRDGVYSESVTLPPSTDWRSWACTLDTGAGGEGLILVWKNLKTGAENGVAVADVRVTALDEDEE